MISGVGISRNILQTYALLMDHYQTGDNIFLFGFSRGAYTARSVAGLMRSCGLLKKQMLNQAYMLYRRQDRASHPKQIEAELFRRAYAREVHVHFIGVWDTGGALGIPIKHFSMLNKLLNIDHKDDYQKSCVNLIEYERKYGRPVVQSAGT